MRSSAQNEGTHEKSSVKLHISSCGTGLISVEFKSGHGQLNQIKPLRKRRVSHSRLLLDFVDVSRGNCFRDVEAVTLPFKYSKFAAWETWNSSGGGSLLNHLDAIQVAMFLQDEETTKSVQKSLRRFFHTALLNHAKPAHPNLQSIQDAILSLNETAQEAIMHSLPLHLAVCTHPALRLAWLRSYSGTLALPPLAQICQTPPQPSKRPRDTETSTYSTLISLLMHNLPPDSCTALEIQENSDLWTHALSHTVLACLPSLREVDLTSCTLNAPAPAPKRLYTAPRPLRGGVTIMARTLARLPSLQALSLQNCSIDNECMEVLAPHLKRMTGLTALDLSNNMLSKSAADALGRVLPSLTRLIELHLGEIMHTTNGRAALTSIGLHKLNCSSLRELYLGGNSLPSSATWLAQYLPAMSNLQVLDLSGVLKQTSTADAAALGAALRYLRSLTHLDLSENYLDSTVLCETLQTLRCLVHVNMSLEKIDLEGIQRTAAAALSMPALTSLELQDLSCGNQEGDVVLCSPGGHLSSLHRLHLVAHCVSGTHMQLLALLLSELPCLYQLKFDSCEFRSDAATDSVLEAMCNLGGLQSLVLDTRIRRFSQDVAEKVFAAINTLNSILHCELAVPDDDHLLLVAPYLSQLTSLTMLQCSSGPCSMRGGWKSSAKALFESACKLPGLKHLVCVEIAAGKLEPIVLVPSLTMMTALKHLGLPIGKDNRILDLKEAFGRMKAYGALESLALYGAHCTSDAAKDSIAELLPVPCSFH